MIYVINTRVAMDLLEQQLESMRDAGDPGRQARRARATLDPAENPHALADFTANYISDEETDVDPNTDLDTHDLLDFGPEADERLDAAVLAAKRAKVITRQAARVEQSGNYPVAMARYMTQDEHEQILDALRAHHARTCLPPPMQNVNTKPRRPR